jgi:hypothetical protein
MKPHRLLFGFVTLLVLVGSACNFITQGIQFTTGPSVGGGDWITESRNLVAFSAVALETYGNVRVELGNSESVEIQAPEDVMDLLLTEVRGGTLFLGIQPGTNLDIDRPIEYAVTLRNLEEVQLFGMGSFTIPSLSPPRFAVSVGGSGDVLVENLDTALLDINLLGSGDIDILDGQADEQSIRIAGSGNVNTAGLECQIAQVSIPGSGEVSLWVTEALEITINGSGEVGYYGDPPLVDQTIRGSGRTNDLGEK